MLKHISLVAATGVSIMLLLGMAVKGLLLAFNLVATVQETNQLLHSRAKLFSVMSSDIAQTEQDISSLKGDVEHLQTTRIGVIYDNGLELILQLPSEYNSKKVKIKYTE